MTDESWRRLNDDAWTAGPAAGPGLLLCHPWWGVNDAVRDWAAWWAGLGRYVVVPDLYAGRVATTVQEAESLAQALDRTLATASVAARADELADRRWAVMGFSMGAGFAATVADRAGLTDLVMVYGGDAPSTVTDGLRVQLHTVPDDPWFEGGEVAELLAGFATLDVAVDRFEYVGAEHWFAEPGSPAYDPDATTLLRDRLAASLA